MKEELGQSKGFVWQSFNTAANYCLNNEVDLEQGMAWIDRGILFSGGNFTMYNTKAQFLEKMDKTAEAKALKKKAMAVGTIREIHGFGSTLLNSGKTEEAFDIFKKNYDKFYALEYEDAVDECTVNLGLSMAYAAKKDMKMALEYGNVGIEKAPPNLKALTEGFVAQLQSDKD